MTTPARCSTCIVKEKWFKAQATIGFWPANARRRRYRRLCRRYAARSRSRRFHTLRQQLEKREGRFNAALSDFIAPAASGVPDYIGAFVVTAGIGEDVVADRFKNANDDYSSILCKALADRLAEAFAERMHARVRREFWGYAPDETLAPDDLILEQYEGIRPAPGYPAQPDHTEKATLFALLDAENTAGVKLTESFAMWPGSSVSGLYFSHPESFYFGVGKIERDQVEDYAARKGWSVAESRALAGAGAELHPGAGPVGAGSPRQGSDADAGAGIGRARQRRRSGIGLASAGLQLRGASGVSQEGKGLIPFHRRPGERFACPGRQLWIQISNSRKIPAARHAPELCFVAPSEKQRAQGRPGARCTRGLACKFATKKTHTSIQVQRKQSGLPCAMVLTVSFVLSPVTGLFCHRRLRITSATLTPASGRQDHTTSPSASCAVRLARAPRPPHPAPRS